MEHYLTFTVEQLVMDRYFRQWVNGELPESDTAWQEFQLQHLDKMDDIELARRIVQSLAMHHETLNEGDLQEQIHRIMANVRPSGRVVPFYRRTWFRVAASTALVGALSGLWLWWQPAFTNLLMLQPSAKESGQHLVKLINNDDKSTRITLSDGSVVVLEKNSELRYPTTFDGPDREVFLSGEALFSVVKNSQKPFLVQTKSLTTKVLGTSFRINSHEAAPDASVSVLTGKVSVFTRNGEPFGNTLTDGVVLVPNQKAVFVKAQERIIKTLVEKPVLLETSVRVNVSDFDDASAADVFERLETAYGVRFIVDRDMLKSCTLTARFTNETLFQKLDLLCEAIQSSYQLVDGQIVVTSKGCQ